LGFRVPGSPAGAGVRTSNLEPSANQGLGTRHPEPDPVHSVTILSLPAFNPGPYTGQGNNTYLITGREPLLVDAGVGDARHLDAIAEALGGADLARVIVTHNHSDHIKGIEAIAARWPEAALLKKPLPERDVKYAVRWTPSAMRCRRATAGCASSRRRGTRPIISACSTRRAACSSRATCSCGAAPS
jgi:hypothetical protein